MRDITASTLRRQYAEGERDFAALSLRRAELPRAVLADATFPSADFAEANFTEAVLTRADFSGADLTEATFIMADAAWANLSSARMPGSRLAGAILQSADLRGAELHDADLSDANLTMANLAAANLRNAKLAGANLTGANLTNADLTFADLKGANLTRADLTGANLTGASLGIANLDRAVLCRARFTEADLGAARLNGADLTQAVFTDARLHGADLSGAMLTDVRGLELDRSRTRDAVFDALARDHWSRLRRGYSMRMTVLHLVILLSLMAPGLLRVARGAWSFPSACGSPDCQVISLWQALIGADVAGTIWTPVFILALFNAARVVLAAWVNLLADAEDRTGASPALSAYRIPGLAHRFVLGPVGLVAIAYGLVTLAAFLLSDARLPRV